MKSCITGILLLLSLVHAPLSAFAGEKTRIAEVKDWIEATPAAETCGDEYLLRRQRLGLQLGLSPLVIAGIVASGALTGGFVGYQIYLAAGTNAGGFADLAALLGGGMIGGLVGVGGAGVETGTVLSKFFKNQHLLRLIYEARNDGGLELDHAYQEYLGLGASSSMSQDEFKAKIAELDRSGALCDGSMVNEKRHRKGKLLKQRIATLDEILTQI